MEQDFDNDTLLGEIERLNNENKYLTMTLRDQFATAALQGILAAAAHPQSAGIPLSEFDITAKHSYLLADAMLKARKEPPCEK